MVSRISSYFFFILLLCAVVASIFIFFPFLTPIILGVAASVIIYPVYRGLSRVFRVKPGASAIRTNLAAFITVLLLIVVIVVPLFFIISKMYVEVQSLYATLTDESNRATFITDLNNLSKTISDKLFNVFPAYSFDSFNITEYLKDILMWVFSNLDKIFKGIVAIAAYVFVFILATFYFLRDGAMIKRKFVSWSPLLDKYDEYITTTLKKAVLSVFGGTIVASVLQGLSTGLAFLVFGIPAPVVWGVLASFAAFVPGVGTSLVIVPGIIYLIIIGNYYYALGLAICGAVFINLIDNVLSPHLVNKGVHIHPFLILISVLGGLSMFGPVGFVLGPLILALLFALLEIYRTSFTDIEKGE